MHEYSPTCHRFLVQSHHESHMLNALLQGRLLVLTSWAQALQLVEGRAGRTSDQHEGLLLIKSPVCLQLIVSPGEAPARSEIHRVTGHQTKLSGLYSNPRW